MTWVNIFKKTDALIEDNILSDDEKLEFDKKSVDSLTEELILIHGVLNFIEKDFSCSWDITTQQDYPLMTMKHITNNNHSLRSNEKEFLTDGMHFITNVKRGWDSGFYTREYAILYIERFYKIREEHLAILFPKL